MVVKPSWSIASLTRGFSGLSSDTPRGDQAATKGSYQDGKRSLERLHDLNALPERLLIIVDGLDEALTYPATDTIVDVLASLTGTLPQPVRLMLTTRPDTGVLRRLSLDPPVK